MLVTTTIRNVLFLAVLHSNVLSLYKSVIQTSLSVCSDDRGVTVLGLLCPLQAPKQTLQFA